jgi:anti-sigma factor RsiW
MQHLDEGTIHAWLDGELPSAERAALEAHIAECEQCAAAVAEARGFVAASSRILTALDAVPGGVLPAAAAGNAGASMQAAPPPVTRRRFVASRTWMAVAAVLVLSTVTLIAVRPGEHGAQLRVAAGNRDEKEPAASAVPAEEKTAQSTPDVSALADSHATNAIAPEPRAPAPAAATTSAPLAQAGGRAMADKRSDANAPAAMSSRAAAPADAPKPVDQTERLKARLESERQLTRVPPSNGAPSAMADVAVPAPATPPVEKDAVAKREASASMNDSMSAQLAGKSAESITITGRVTSNVGVPLAAASVALDRTGIATTTRDDGSYKLVVPAAQVRGDTTSLVARLIGYKAAVVPLGPTDNAITHDFVLTSSPLALNEVVVTGEGTSNSIRIRGMQSARAHTSEYRALANGDSAEILSHTSSAVSGEPIEITTYRVRDDYVTLIDRLRPDTTRPALDKKVTAPLERRQDAYARAINSITWTDSAGRIRTLRGAMPTTELERLKALLFGATP